MHIISEFHKDTQSEKPKPGSYEWWYFDAMSDDGYSLVVIFYDGNPFSRRYIKTLKSKKGTRASEFPAISISIYKDGNPLFYSFEEVYPKLSDFSDTKPFGRIKENYFEGFCDQNEMKFTLMIHQKLDTGDMLKGSLVFHSPKTDLSGITTTTDMNEVSQHCWNLVMANCRVECKLALEGYQNKKIEFSGRGYHDHNTGSEPMKDRFREWYWGRYHIGEASLIYYLMLVKGGWRKRVWFIDEVGVVKKLDQKMEVSNKGFNLFGLESARTFHFEGGGVEAFIQLDHVVDNGPFYQRFEGKVILNRGERPEQAMGISEYIFPSRIFNPVFWPLVNMRIKYPGKSHWVQRHRNLYRLTW